MVRQVENSPVGANDKPEKVSVIEDCGELPEGADIEEFTKKAPDSTGDTYEDFPDDELPKGEEWKGAQIVEIATTLKDMGGSAFKGNDIALALSKYEKALRYVHEYPAPLEGDAPDLGKQLNTLKIALYNNSSLMQYKLKQYKESSSSADKAIGVEGATDKDKGKSLFRKGQAANAMKNEDEALQYLEEAQTLIPADAGVKNELAIVKKGAADRKAKERKAYSKMFD